MFPPFMQFGRRHKLNRSAPHCTQVNITSNLATRVTMHQCRGCLKYMGGSGGSGWGHYEHESRELMAMCLKKVNGLSRLRLIDAQWIWTEPHSKR